MNAPVTTDIIDRIGVIRIDNPPVNALNNAVRSGIADAVTALGQDSGLDAVVIACAGRTLIAGADIKEFGKHRQPPSLAETCDEIEVSPKPVNAELHGMEPGGGVEIAQDANDRNAAPGNRRGRPGP